ncbi:MAG: hypothetical protein ACIALR_00495 [Blastopirellula sp. JB062]
MTGRYRVLLCLTLAFWCGGRTQLQARIWVDAEGRTLDAEFVRYHGTSVQLRRNDNGELLEVHFSKFCDADKRRILVLREAAEKREAEKQATAKQSDLIETLQADDGDEKNAPSEKEARRDLTRMRKWSDNEGNQIQAKFVRIFEGNVILLQGNKGHSVDFYKLGVDDQKFLRDHLEALDQGDLVPPVILDAQEPNVVNQNGVIVGASLPENIGRSPFSGPPPNGPDWMAEHRKRIAEANAEFQRRQREHRDKLAKTMAENRPTYEPQKIVSHTPPAYDPWTNSKSARNTETGPPASTPSVASRPGPRDIAEPLPTIPEPKRSAPTRAKAPSDDEPGWYCSVCKTEFHSDVRPSFCHFCVSLRIGGVVVLAMVGVLIRMALS